MLQFPCQTWFRQMLIFNINFVSDILSVVPFGPLALTFLTLQIYGKKSI